ncbi:MAG: putative toxin-antitoxin system toxin component, PIN family [Gemmatimonadales bacterium]|nr:MAG: putative toxin-antitoxin system toxin component, PIN family [Gemmatimonadales bacterium]
MRVFLDTNVLASAVATRGICADILRIALAEHRLLVGEAVLAELERVLVEKFRVPAELARETDEFLRREGEVLGPGSPLDVQIRDPDDIAILAEAVSGRADVLVTGDKDLLEVAEAAPIPVVSPRGFWDLLRSGADQAPEAPGGS